VLHSAVDPAGVRWPSDVVWNCLREIRSAASFE
jgi:hypothetical protein